MVDGSIMKEHLKKINRKFDTTDKSKYDYVLNQSERSNHLPFIHWKRFLKTISQEDFFFYPNTQPLVEKIANHKYYNLTTDNIFLCAGSDVGIKTIFETFTNGGRVITTDPSFPMYKVYSELYQCEYFGIPHEKDYTISIEKILSNITHETDLIILANPNSPMGEYKSFDEIIPLLEQDVPVVIDEAYLEFTHMDSHEHHSLIKYIDDYPNLIVTRTFSKGWGGAGCRVGMVVSNKDNIELISKFRHMYEISGISMRWVEFFLDNFGIVEDYWKDVLNEKTKLHYMLRNFEIIDSNCNWIHFNTEDDNKKTIEVFKEHKVLVKYCELPHDNRHNWCRLTIKPGMCDEHFIQELIDAY